MGNLVQLSKSPFLWALGLSFFSVLVHLIFLTYWNREEVGLDRFIISYFGDGMFKYLQIQDFLKTGSFSCQYLGKTLDPNYQFLVSSKVVTIQENKCYYLYPGFFSYLLSFLVRMFGIGGVFLYQHSVLLGLLVFTVLLGKRENISKANIVTTLFLTFLGTGVFFAVFDLEEHLTVAFLFLTGYYFTHSKESIFIVLGAILVSLTFFIRTEMIAFAFLLPFSLYLEMKVKGKQNKSQIAFVTCLIPMLICLCLCLFLNQLFFFHPLGIKAFDPIHAGSILERIVSGFKNLFFSFPMFTNPFFFQFPIFLILAYRLTKKKQWHHLILFSSVLLFAFLSPIQSTFYLGMRFALFLYPIGMILYFKTRDFQTGLLKRERALLGFSLLLSFCYCLLFFRFTDSYYQNYKFIKNQGAELLVARDTQVFQSTFDLSHKIPVLLIDKEGATAFKRILSENRNKKIVIVGIRNNSNHKGDLLIESGVSLARQSVSNSSNAWLTAITIFPHE